MINFKKRVKEIFIFLMIIFLYGCEQNTLVRSGNMEKKPLEFDFKTTRDADCGMVVDGLKFSAQVISEDGRTWFFHDPGGVAKFLKNQNFNGVIWFYTMDTKKWLRSDKVWFSMTDQTPMGYGFAAYEKPQKDFITYKEMELKMLRGENLNNPFIRKSLLNES